MTCACGSHLADAADGFDPLHLRHAQVEQGDVGAMALEGVDRFAAVRRLGDDLQVGLVIDDVGDAGAQQRVVVHDQHARRTRPAPAARPSRQRWPSARSRDREGRRLPGEHDLGAGARRGDEGQRGADALGALLHAGHAEPGGRAVARDAAAVVGHRQPEADAAHRAGAHGDARRRA